MSYCVTELSRRASQLVRQGIRPGTQRSYTSAQSRYIDFCQRYHITPLPLHPTTTLWYVTYLYDQGLSHASINVYISALRSLHIMQGLPEPAVRTPQVQLALRAIKARSQPSQQKAPLTFHQLHTLLQHLEGDPERELWVAVFSLAFFAGLRGAEYTLNGLQNFRPQVNWLKFSTLAGEPVVTYSVPISKTRAHGFAVPLGCSKQTLCAYCALVSYMNIRHHQGTLSSTAPLFLSHTGANVTKPQTDSKLKQLCNKAGLDSSHYTTHSIRAGAATTAAELGFSDWEIMKLGGWSSSAYRAYIRQLDSHIVNFSARLASSATAS